MDEARDWWEQLFQIREYRQFESLAAELTRGEVDFLLQALGLSSEMSVLDLGCGNGRHVLELARRGVRAVGLEQVEPVVEHARQRAEREQLQASFVVGDMRQLEALGPFDAILMMNSSFGFFSELENAALLREVAGALVPGGQLLLQCINPYQMVSYLAGFRSGWHQVGQGYVLRSARFEPRQGALLIDYRYLEPGQPERRHPGDRIRVYSYPELEQLLRAAGLQPAAVFGDAALPVQPFEEASLWQVLLARKPELALAPEWEEGAPALADAVSAQAGAEQQGLPE